MVIYHLVSSQYVIVGPIEHQNVHLGFSLLLVFLVSLKKDERYYRPITLGFFVLALIAVGYIQVFYVDLENRMEFPTNLDLLIGAILLIVVLEATRRSLGFLLSAVALFFIAYAILGEYLPRPFKIYPFSPTQVIYELSTGFTGIYGIVLSVSANYVFLFVLLGGILTISGSPRFFRELGIIVARTLKGGPAMTAVVGSSLVGSVTGAPSANIALTGSFTIPLMKQAGYRPEQAGAIEAAASTGGQIMPPVMSAAAFIMAGITGIPYVRVMLAALLPAILYYVSIALYVQLQAMKMDLRPLSGEGGNYREILLSAPNFLVPLLVIISLFMTGYSPKYVGFWGVVVSFVLAFFRKETRPTLTQCVEGFTSGAVMGAAIGVSCACIGVMVKVLTMTGLGVKLPAIVEAWSGGSLFLALLMVMIASLILGCGVPTAPAYIMVAIVGAPVLLKLGLTMLQAHFFVFYFAVMSMLTPPVAPAAVVASRLAQTSFIRTAIEEVKPAIAGFLVPYMIIWSPILILEPQGPLLVSLSKLLGLFVAILALQIGINNHYFLPCKTFERAISFFSAGLLFLGSPFKGISFLAALFLGLIAFVVLTVGQTIRKRRVTGKMKLEEGPGLISGHRET